MPATNELLQEGRYRINHESPLDGHAAVYEAYDTVRNANVLVKEIVVRLNRVTTMSQQESMKAAFANQAKILSGINHDSLLHVHDYFSEVGRQYLVLEPVDGDDLKTLLERNRSAFAVSDVVDWSDQLLDALNYLHTFNPPIIHRNIRPQHIRLLSSGKIKLLAFGLADGGDARLTTTLSDETDAGMNYSPLEIIWDSLDPASQKVISNSYDDRSERLLKEPADARSDIYSLGATLYHLVTGEMPVDPLERSIELLDGNDDPLKAPHKVDPKIPVEFSEVLMRALEIPRENRFDSAVIMRQVIRTAMVRVKERESANGSSPRVAAAAAPPPAPAASDSVAQPLPQADKTAEARERAEEEKRRQQALDAQLREAEAQRLAAERKAAEAKRELEEKQAAKAAEEERLFREKEQKERDKAEAAAKAKAEADARAKAEADARAKAEEKAKAEAAAVLHELKQDLLQIEAEEASPAEGVEIVEVTAEDIVVPAKVEAAEVRAYGAAAASKSAASGYSAHSDSDVELGGVFAGSSEPTGSGVSMPMIAGIAGVVLLLVIVGWYMMSSGSSDASKTAAAPASDSAVQTQQAPSAETQSSAAQPASAAVGADTESQQADPQTPTAASQRAAKPADPKTKKPDPAKPAEKKKSVTVDDLINDN